MGKPQILGKLLYFFFCLPFQVISQRESTTLKIPDSVIISASDKYEGASLFQRLFIGKNYREEWSTPVKMPVFHIENYNGGFKISKLGGGMQTRSLQIVDKDGVEWALRTVDKEVEKALPKKLRHTIAEKIVQDMVSGAYPYAPSTTGILAKAAGVIAPEPLLFFVPDDPAFGKFRSIFANNVCYLEQREPSPDHSDSISTEKVIEKIVKENDHLVLQKAVLKARLLDMLIADWDRHSGQWRWGKIDSIGKKFYYASPRDRDQAFFKSNGLLIKLMTLFSLRHLKRGFTTKSKGLKNLNYKSWAFDHFFLNQLTSQDWENIIKEFQADESDSIIDEAVKNLPPEIYSISGTEIGNKLKARRDGLLKNSMRYHTFISQKFNPEKKYKFSLVMPESQKK